MNNSNKLKNIINSIKKLKYNNFQNQNLSFNKKTKTNNNQFKRKITNSKKS